MALRRTLQRWHPFYLLDIAPERDAEEEKRGLKLDHPQGEIGLLRFVRPLRIEATRILHTGNGDLITSAISRTIRWVMKAMGSSKPS